MASAMEAPLTDDKWPGQRMHQAVTAQERAFCKAAAEPHSHSHCTDLSGGLSSPLTCAEDSLEGI